MKKTFLFTLLIGLNLNNLTAQTNHPFAHSGGVWGQVSASVNQWPPFDLSGGTYFEASTGDTIINNTAYFKISGSDSLGNAEYFSRALREDSTGKVWWFDYITNTDKLLYDFNVVAGDTVTVTPPLYSGPACPMVVDSLSTIDVLGSPRKAIYLGTLPFTCTAATVYPGQPLFWIEGIGSNAGLFFPSGEFIADGVFWLSCYRENGQLAFGNTCNIFLSTDKPVTSSSIELYPNPFTDQFEIQFPNGNTSKFILTLYDVSGQIIFSESKQAASSVTISLPALPSGFYFLKMEEGNELRYTTVVKR